MSDEPAATTPQYRAQVRVHEHAVNVIADGLTAAGWEASVYDTARAVLAVLFTDPDLLREMANAAAPDPSALSA